jgi:hypothetical protein
MRCRRKPWPDRGRSLPLIDQDLQKIVPRCIAAFAESSSGRNASMVSGSHSMRGAAAAPKRCAIEDDLFPARRMPPRMRIIEKKIGDVERRPFRASKRQLLERAPAHENAVGGDLDEGEITMHGC